MIKQVIEVSVHAACREYPGQIGSALSTKGTEDDGSDDIEHSHPVVVITVAYNCSISLDKCLESVGDDLVRSVVVVDNSDDMAEKNATRLVAEKHSATYIATAQNLGFGSAVNRGVANAGLAEDGIVWFLNPDTVVEKGSAAVLVAELIADRADIVSPVLTTGRDRKGIWFAGGRLNERFLSVRHDQKDSDVTKLKAGETTNYLTGAAMMMSLKTWNEVGGFDERIFLYWEDADFCIRASGIGLRMAVVSDARVWHAVGATTSTTGKSAIYYYWMQRSRVYVLVKHHGMRALVDPTKWVESIRIASRAVREADDRYMKSRAAALGLFEGLVHVMTGAKDRESLIGPESRVKRVLVLWADGDSANLGVRVLAEGARELAKSLWGQNIEIVCQDFGGASTGVSLGAKAILANTLRRNGAIRQHFSTFDVVLDTGAGDSFTDIYGLKRLFTMVYSQRLLHKMGVPVVMAPQTIGPFSGFAGRTVARYSLKGMRCVVARDGVSANCADELGREVDVVSTDLVFMLPPPSKTRNSDVILNVSGLLWNENVHVEYLDYRIWVRKLIEGLLDAGRQVTLIAHVLDSLNSDNDVPVVRLLHAEFESRGVLSVIPESLEEAREAMCGASFVVGSRMHACLNALSVGVPAVAWAYSRKFQPLLEAIGWTLVVDLKEDLNVDEITLSYVLNPGSAFEDVQQVRDAADDLSGMTASAIAAKLASK